MTQSTASNFMQTPDAMIPALSNGKQIETLLQNKGVDFVADFIQRRERSIALAKMTR